MDKEVKELLTIKNTCLRKGLYVHFEEEPSNVKPGHLCCTYCHTVCSCSSGTCAEPTSNYEQIKDKPVSLRSRQVTVNDKSSIAELLNDYRDSLNNSSIHMYTSHAACTGFSQDLVDAVLTHYEYIFDLKYIINNIPLEIIDQDVQSVLDESDPALYFSNYFDYED